MAIVIKKKKKAPEAIPPIDVEGWPEPDEDVVKLMILLARRHAWRDHVASLQKRKELL